jgi:hypothetical protein
MLNILHFKTKILTMEWAWEVWGYIKFVRILSLELLSEE